MASIIGGTGVGFDWVILIHMNPRHQRSLLPIKPVALCSHPPFVAFSTVTSPLKTRRPQTNMTQSPARSSSSTAKIPVEIISEEEMSLVEAAFAAAAATPPSTRFQRNVRSIRSITLLSKRRLSVCTESGSTDIEDSDRVSGSNSQHNINRKLESFLHRFRRRRGLSVTDITATEWCEKKMEFFLLFGKPELSKAMKAGIARHMALEEEVVKRVKVHIESAEDTWAVKFLNFIVGTNQLLFQGLTRELPVVGFAEGVWMVGIIDEIRMPMTESERFPILVDTKTRVQATLPSEPQRRNGRLQLMCYKYLWDSLVAEKFSAQKFFDFFSLNRHYILSPEVRQNTDKSGFPSETLDDLMRHFQNSCCLLPRAQDQLLLRYELQDDQSLLGEDEFTYDADWVKGQINSCLEFWQGEREAMYTPPEERWKCRYCKFASVCPANSNLDDASATQNENKHNLPP